MKKVAPRRRAAPATRTERSAARRSVPPPAASAPTTPPPSAVRAVADEPIPFRPTLMVPDLVEGFAVEALRSIAADLTVLSVSLKNAAARPNADVLHDVVTRLALRAQTSSDGADRQLDRAVAAEAPTLAPPPPARRGRAEEAALGIYDPMPFDRDLAGCSNATMLAQALAPLSDELVPGGIIQAGDELSILGAAVDGGLGETSHGRRTVASAVYVLERRLRMLAVIARKALAPLEKRVAA